MKRIIVLFTLALAFYSCEKENEALEISSDLVENTTDKTQEIKDANKYFGVFSTFDSELHGEIRIKQESKNHYSARVELLNSEVLQFKGLKSKHSNLVNFKGKRGSFSIDFSENSTRTATSFLVDNKEGYIKTYKDTNRGGGIQFGSYIDDSDSNFTGNWDMITLGNIDPASGFQLIENITISHTGGLFFSDETAGVLEPFFDNCINSVNMTGAATDGSALVLGADQIATFNGEETIWNMVFIFGQSFDPTTCNSLPGANHGTWSRNGRSGTLTIIY